MANVNDIINKAKDFINPLRPGPAVANGPFKNTKPDMDIKLNGTGKGDGLYSVIKENWYTAKPYGFTFNPRGQNASSITMFLPISPSNIAIQTQFATNVITTLYGTVEEHSEVRYYDITISGTTGFAPKYVYPVENYSNKNPAPGRANFDVRDAINLGGFFSKTLSMFSQIVDKATDILGSNPPVTTGVYSDESGYLAFHNLYRFLLKYKRDAAGQDSIQLRTQHPLTFFNYKDNTQYDVAIRSFNLTRDSENPMLYNYSIQLRGYNLRSAGLGASKEDITQRLKDLGLAGVKSGTLLGDIKNKTDQAKQIVGAAAGGTNTLGR